jgi:tetratricopeptide (TPR) repeat protein
MAAAAVAVATGGQPMTNRRAVVAMSAAFLAGVVSATLAGKLPRTDPSMYSGKEAKEAARALLDVAVDQTEGGSWETIGVGRVHYLSGDKAKGQAIFDGVTGKKLEKSDLWRIARIYEEAGEWDKAASTFDRAMALDPKDDSAQAEAGARHNLHVNRARAEELLGKAFAKHPTGVWNSVMAAGSYVGVKPD